jgi:hypothetical protein
MSDNNTSKKVRVYEVVYKVIVPVDSDEVEAKRKQSRGAFLGGAFNRDTILEKLIASSKALELVIKQDEEHVSESIRIIDTAGFDFDAKEYQKESALLDVLLEKLLKGRGE